jgi:MoaA/NifB/PqqE/SkfB family radical SAM enzyme
VELSLPLVEAALADAAAEGYNLASFSGGEPFLYRSLDRALEIAGGLGLRTAVTTNGMLLRNRDLSPLRKHACLVAVSLDGVPASHNRLRASERAFAGLCEGVARLRQADVPFGFIFTLTQFNVHELDWVGHFAVEQGAALLQIHPLEAVGRARTDMADSAPDGTEQTFALLQVARLRALVGERVRVQLDVASPRAIAAVPESVFAAAPCEDLTTRPLAELLSPLVIETDGSVVPLRYGFARQHSLGNLNQARLSTLARAWRQNGHDSFRALCRGVFEEIVASDDRRPLDWYARVSARADDGVCREAG